MHPLLRSFPQTVSLPRPVETQTRMCASPGDLPPGEREEEQGWSVNLISPPNSPSHRVLLFKGAGSRRAERGPGVDIKGGPFVFKETSGVGGRFSLPNTGPPQPHSQCLRVSPRLLLLLLRSISCTHPFSSVAPATAQDGPLFSLLLRIVFSS